MNRKIAAEFPIRLRTFCAQTSPRPSVRPEYASPQQILADPAMQELLKRSNLSPSSQITDNETKLSILSHLSEKCNIPVASNAFLNMSSPEDIASWYSEQLKPCRARPHARNLILNTLTKGDDSQQIHDRIDLDRENVQVELESQIPSNLVLDEKTFLKVDETWVRKRSLPKPQLGKH